MTKLQISQWQKHYEKWRKSGLTQPAYCQKAGINYSTFKNKILALNKTGQIKTSKIVGITKYVAVEVEKEVKELPYCEIRFGNGSGIRIDRPEAINELGKLIRSLSNA